MNDMNTLPECDPHTLEIMQLVQAMNLAFVKLSPPFSAETRERYGEFLLSAQKDLNVYLDEHLKDVDHIKNN